jgi:hypothetical protein
MSYTHEAVSDSVFATLLHLFGRRRRIRLDFRMKQDRLLRAKLQTEQDCRQYLE